MFKNLFSSIEKLINEHGSSVILKERLSLLKDQLTAVERECGELKEKCRRIQEENARLTAELNEKIIPDEFTENSGVLFKRDSTGSYIPSAFCPKCKNPLFNTDPLIFPYTCNIPGCHFLIHITEPLYFYPLYLFYSPNKSLEPNTSPLARLMSAQLSR